MERLFRKLRTGLQQTLEAWNRFQVLSPPFQEGLIWYRSGNVLGSGLRLLIYIYYCYFGLESVFVKYRTILEKRLIVQGCWRIPLPALPSVQWHLDNWNNGPVSILGVCVPMSKVRELGDYQIKFKFLQAEKGHNFLWGLWCFYVNKKYPHFSVIGYVLDFRQSWIRATLEWLWHELDMWFWLTSGTGLEPWKFCCHCSGLWWSISRS